MSLCFLTRRRHNDVFLIQLAILSSSIILLNCQRIENCTKSSCFCIESYGEVEYQCPNMYADNKVVIHKEKSQAIRVECWSITNIDLLLPNVSFAGDDITISECPVTFLTSLAFNIIEVKKLKVENVEIVTSFDMNFFTLPMNHLTKLRLKATNFDEGFHGIIAPNLTFLDLEEIEIKTIEKILRNISKLLKLNLSFNKISVLEKKMFENLPNLEILVLSQNSIGYLDDEVFKNLKSLRHLHLDSNDLTTIYDDAFRNLGNLYILDISNNNIQKMKREILRPLISIEHIYIDYNFGIELDDYLFSNFSQLKTVSLINSDIQFLPENIFIGSGKITQISLENNRIQSIANGLFRGLSNLKILKLSNNRLTSLNNGIFDSLVKLKILHIHSNVISSMDTNILKSLTLLEELNLNNNKISHIDNDAFKFNQNLRKLHLSNNRYSYKIHRKNYFSPSPFSSCLNLNELDLSNNLIEDIPDDLFSYAKYLRNVNLRGNKIETAHESLLWKVARRGVLLNLEFNHITQFIFDSTSFLEEEIYSDDESSYDDDGDSIILISNNPLNCDCSAEKFLDLLTKKVTLSTDIGLIFKYDELFCNEPENLYNTKFSEVSPMDLVCPFEEFAISSTCTSSKRCHCFWRPHDKSIIIDCIRRSLTAVPEILVSTDLDYNQTEVHLEENNLKEGPNGKTGYNNVTKLYLSHNQLSKIVWIPPKIEVLELSNNKLNNISNNVLQLLNGTLFENLTLGNNPWICDCEIEDLLKFLRKNIQKVDARSMKCYSTGVNLLDLNLSDICEASIIMHMSLYVALCTLLILLLAILVIYYKYNQQIKIWLYARNICARFIEEEELDKDKTYDVFISYSHKDEDFVINNLVSELEKEPHPYKLCLHYRDWIPGDFIVHNIISSVENSRRTLIVLTPNFLESVWGKMEFRYALTETMKEGRNRIILILKGDLSIDSLDDELKMYVKTITYIKWKDIWFWDKLKHALPHRRM